MELHKDRRNSLANFCVENHFFSFSFFSPRQVHWSVLIQLAIRIFIWGAYHENRDTVYFSELRVFYYCRWYLKLQWTHVQAFHGFTSKLLCWYGPILAGNAVGKCRKTTEIEKWQLLANDAKIACSFHYWKARCIDQLSHSTVLVSMACL